MTWDDLNQLLAINKEITRLKRRKEELRTFAEGSGGQVTGLPHVQGKTDRTGTAADMADIQTIIDRQISQTIEEYKKLSEFIEGIHDSSLRQIFSLRFLDCMTWPEVAAEYRPAYVSPDALRMRVARYMQSKTS